MKKRISWWKAIIIGFCIIWLLAFSVFVVGWFYRDQLTIQLKKTIEQKADVRVQVGSAGLNWLDQWPFLAFAAHDFQIYDSLYPKQKNLIFSAQKISCRLAIFPLLKGNLNIHHILLQNASLNLHQDSLGNGNMYIFKNKNKKDTTNNGSSAQLDLNLKKISIYNLKVIFEDATMHKDLKFTLKKVLVNVSKKDNITRVSWQGKAYSEGLAFNTKRGAFLKNSVLNTRFDLAIIPDSNKIKILPSSSVFSHGQSYGLSGGVDMASKPVLYLNIKADSIYQDSALPILPAKLAAKIGAYKVDGALNVLVNIRAPLTDGLQPRAQIWFSSKSSNLSLDVLARAKFSKMNFSGLFDNQANPRLQPSDPNSFLDVKLNKAIVNGLDISGNMHMLNFKRTFLKANVDLSGPFQRYFDIIDAGKAVEAKGKASLAMQIEGNWKDLFNHPQDKGPWILKGNLKIDNASVRPAGSDMDFENISANIALNKDILKVNRLDFDLIGNRLEAKGRIGGLLSMAMGVPATVTQVNIEAFSPNLNASDFFETQDKKTKEVGGGLQKFRWLIEKPLDLHLIWRANAVKFKDFKAQKLVLELDRSAKNIDIRKLQMRTLSGKLDLRGNLSPIANRNYLLNLYADAENIEIGSLMNAFENFGQKVVFPHHLSGQANANLAFNMRLNSNLQYNQKFSTGKFGLSIVNGRLNNFEPLTNLSSYIRNRDLANVAFSRIETQIYILGQAINLQTFEIVSNLMRMKASGTVNIGGKDMDLRLSVPTSNLWRMPKNWQTGKNAKDVSMLKFKVVREDGKPVKINYDFDSSREKILKRFAKKEKKAQ